MTRRVWLGLGTLALAGLGLGVSPAVAMLPRTTLPWQLQTAVCLNDWATAIDHTSAMIALPDISAQSRQELVDFRHRLQRYQTENLQIQGLPGCEEHLTQYLEVVPTPSPPLQLDRALQRQAGIPDLTPDPLTRQINATQRAGLLEPDLTDIPALSPALLIGTPNGTAVTAGAVSAGVEVFAFVGGQGDQVTVDVTVTRILPGLRYTDDDSQLYLFDSQGYLIASNDDFNGLQSRLDHVPLPGTDLYYVAVTTYGNYPELSPDGQLLGWSGGGGSFIEYTLTVTGLTPSGQLALPRTAQR
ncbi:hypothetical protein GFS31_24840 [Leptolyngbya sp. BL0902]|uniref:hypothetical protein n=1 Tax=Leptolyngbya sp. BL0902 TaxID=1115757 RepID=UPI0018E79C88|nr:hypothetical protein [Leptolyngbya sp. BL0902]QQE65794.1 hypothetical protein GFS31_24840 [Leptolyngbya sp. BL0902]